MLLSADVTLPLVQLLNKYCDPSTLAVENVEIAAEVWEFAALGVNIPVALFVDPELGILPKFLISLCILTGFCAYNAHDVMRPAKTITVFLMYIV